ncbi:MAG: hypothetical protein HY928_10030 [Elusimicrobia bacterium]|nr:hypothetical protein [Elusimicrobiota bacterium]
MNLPELRRARKEWLTNPRLLIGTIGASAVLAVFAGNLGKYNAGSQLTGSVIYCQFVVLFFYGIPCLVADFVEEHQKKTWDLLALTPLSASEIVLGKLVAATSYAVFLAAVMAPWALYAQSLPGAGGVLNLTLNWAWMGVAFVGTAFLSLAAAAATARLQEGRIGIGGLALGGLGFLGALFGQTVVGTSRNPQVLGPALLLCSGLWWTAWAAVAALRQVGRLLSERPASWVFPGFLAALWTYALLFAPLFAVTKLSIGLYVCATVPAVAALMGALLDRDTPSDAGRVPSWAWSLLTVAGLCAATGLMVPDARRIALMAPLFLTRDLLLLARIRRSRVKNAETVAIGLIGLLYLAPAAYFAAARDGVGLHWVVPMVDPAMGWASNCLPALAHALGAALLFRSGGKKSLKPS